MSNPLNALYRDILLDHYRSPRGNKPIEHFDSSQRGSNPACGDELNLAIAVNDNRISDVSVQAIGCAISVASSSMLTEAVQGMTLDEASRFAETIRSMMKGEDVPKDFELGDLDSLSGVRDFPVRVKCALLSWVTLLDAIRIYHEGLDGGERADSGVVSTEAPGDKEAFANSRGNGLVL